MTPFTTLTALAAPLDVVKIDTGMIIPGRYNRKYRRPGFPDYAEAFLHDLRFDTAEKLRPDFVLNQPAFQGAEILVTALDFGCGSSRETAATMDFGLRALIGVGFGDIFHSNCLQNGILTVVLLQLEISELWRQLLAKPGSKVAIDLENQTVTTPEGNIYAFDMDPRPLLPLASFFCVFTILNRWLLRPCVLFEESYRKEMTWLNL